MARTKNDGKGRLGGRQKGTPNKVTKGVREWLAKLINKNRKQIEVDLQQLDPKDRIMLLEKLMQYVIPKQQNIKAEVENLTDAELSEIATQILNHVYKEDFNNGD